MEGGREAAGEAGGKARQTREREEADVDVGAQGVVPDIVRQEAEEGAHRERRERDAERPADDREQHAVGQELPTHAAPRRPQGEPRPDLSPPRGAAGEEQTGDVQAGEPKQNGRRGKEHPERLRQGASQR